MALDITARRRRFGTIVLLIAVAMLVLGETVLEGRLSSLVFLLYWLTCLVLTGIAVLVAFLDVQALRARTRREHRDLLEDALKEISEEARDQPRKTGKGRSGD